MALLAISAAQLKFDPFDHIWHIYTPKDIQTQARDGHIMHVPVDAGVNLIEMPFISLGDSFLNIPPAANTAQAVQNAKQLQMVAEERARCKLVEQALTRRRRDTLRAFAAGLDPQKVADILVISLSTVNTHSGKIFEECRIAWELPQDYRLTYHFLREHFANYFASGE